MNLVIDIGNTQLKLAWFENDVLVHFYRVLEKDLSSHVLLHAYERAIVSSVRDVEFTNSVKDQLHNVLVMDHLTPVPVENTYDTPLTLGLDRMVNVVAASSQFPGENVLVDAGTCLKFDLIDHAKRYLGGSISPGLTMRLKSLNTFTDNLPLIAYEPTKEVMGKSTTDSILVGVYQGMMAEIKQRLVQFEEKFPHLQVVLTGGDAECFESLDMSQKNSIFADNFLTLKGLNEILKYNEKH